MAVELHSVESSYCDAIGHDPEANELHVRWPSGKVSIYSDVNADQHEAVIGASSVGHEVYLIKKTRAHRYA